MEGEVIKVNASQKQMQEIASDNKLRIPFGPKLRKGLTLEVHCNDKIESFVVKKFIVKRTHIHVTLK
jgi:hypothetical protein